MFADLSRSITSDLVFAGGMLALVLALIVVVCDSFGGRYDRRIEVDEEHDEIEADGQHTHETIDKEHISVPEESE